MVFTDTAEWLNTEVDGYVVNAKFSENNALILEKVIKIITDKFGDSVQGMQRRSLHITLLDWVAPLVEYAEKDKTELFNNLYPSHNNALHLITASHKRIIVNFSQIKVSSDAIFIVGTDSGEFESLRHKFISSVTRPEESKSAPSIIHSTLVRFKEPLDMDVVSKFIKDINISFIQEVRELNLTHVSREPMLDYEIIKRYPLI